MKSTNPLEISDVSHTWSVSEWESWVGKQVASREKIYSENPSYLTSEYKRDVDSTKSYHGRELLELVQNANDAGKYYPQSVKALISLTPSGLCVANTGITFSSKGIESLMLSNNSPKLLDGADYIGNKGLGFRSILSWTDCPIILSGNLSLSFNRSKAIEWLHQLCSTYENIKDTVEGYRVINEHPVSTLVYPVFLDVVNSFGDFDEFNTTLDAAFKLRQKGYDTVIAMPFTSSSHYEGVKNQLEQIGSQVLIFTNYLKTLTLDIEGEITEYKVNQVDNIIELSSSSSDAQYWEIFEEQGTIPAEHLQSEQTKTRNYEIKLAIPVDESEVDGFIYNYFPTQVRFPFPLVAHATFELTTNRQNLIESNANRYVTKRLAELLAQVAEQNTSNNFSEPWKAFSLISPSGNIDPALEKLGFHQKLIHAIKSKQIIPVCARYYVASSNAYYYNPPSDFTSWLPIQNFEDVVLFSNDSNVHTTLRKLNLAHLDKELLVIRLNLVSNSLTVSARANLIIGLLQTDLFNNTGKNSEQVPSLLIDSASELVQNGEDIDVFILPASNNSFQLPSWSSLRFLNQELINELRKSLNISNRELADRLKLFNVKEYALVNIINKIVKDAGKKIADNLIKESKYKSEVLETIYKLYSQNGAGASVVLPPNLEIDVLTEIGTFIPANTAYFGKTYSIGQLTGLLYENIHPDLFIASPDNLPFAANPETITAFFRWLGVAELPRTYEILKLTYRNDYFKFVISQFSYPISIDGRDFENKAKVEELHQSFYIENITTIDSIEDIIKFVDPHVILAWIAIDTRIEAWRTSNDPTAKFCFDPYGRKIRQYNGKIPSYVVWQLQTKNWLPTSKDTKSSPQKCVWSPALSDDLQPILPRPYLNPSHPIFKTLNIDNIKFKAALSRVGVKRDLDDLTWDDFYSLLLNHPEADTQGQYAKILYRALISRPETEDSPSGNAYKTFLSKGLLWGKHGNISDYYPIKDLKYIDNLQLPEFIQHKLKLLDLDKRRGAKKVRNLLGVETLDASQVVVSITGTISHSSASLVELEFEQLKPFIYATRLYSEQEPLGISNLKKLRLNLCASAEGSFQIGQLTVPIELKNEGESIIDQNNVVYLVSQSYEPTYFFQNELIADTLGEHLATILRIERGSDYARIITCKPFQRLNLLARILGIDISEVENLLLQARQKLDLPLDVNNQIFYEPSPLIAEQIVGSQNLAGNSNTQESNPALPGSGEPNSVNSDLSLSQANSKSIGQVTVNQIDKPTAKEPQKIPSRVRVSPTKPPGPIMPNRYITDANRCQIIALRFEEAPEQERFPLAVDHLQGYMGPSCDILSFASYEDREAFEKLHNSELVLRFIEVKGRNNETAAIQLAGNELKGAQKYGEKYFIYRVFESSNNEIEIATLCNPAANASNIIFAVNLNHRLTKFWKVHL